MTHINTGITSSSFISGNEEHLASLQPMLKNVRDRKIDLEEARKINNRSQANYHKIWVPGPEVLTDALLAKHIICACPPEATNGCAKYTMLPLYTTKIASLGLDFMPKVTTLHSKNGVSLYLITFDR